MENVRLGKTEITVNKNGFGALPIQRILREDAVRLLHRAYDGGINESWAPPFRTDGHIFLSPPRPEL